MLSGGDDRLADLAVETALTAHHTQLHDLLGDRGAARCNPTSGHVRDQGACCRPQIYTVVKPELAVLHRHDRGNHVIGHLVQRDDLAVDVVHQDADRTAVGVEHLGSLGTGTQIDGDVISVSFDRIERARCVRRRGAGTDRHDGCADRDHHGQQGQPGEPAGEVHVELQGTGPRRAGMCARRIRRYGMSASPLGITLVS